MWERRWQRKHASLGKLYKSSETRARDEGIELGMAGQEGQTGH